MTTKKISASILAPALLLAGLFGALPSVASADSNSSNRIEVPTVSMNAEGKILVKQAKVTSVSGTTINASVTLGSGTLSFIVNTDTSTKFYSRAQSAGTLGDIAVGDMVTFGGNLQGSNLTVQALAVKDLTGVVSNATVGGKVETINASGLSVVLDKSGNDRKVTVQTNASTAITMNGAVLPFAQILVGDRVKATGSLSADGLTLTATSLTVSRPSVSETKNFNGFIKSWFKDDKGKGKGRDHAEDD